MHEIRSVFGDRVVIGDSWYNKDTGEQGFDPGYQDRSFMPQTGEIWQTGAGSRDLITDKTYNKPVEFRVELVNGSGEEARIQGKSVEPPPGGGSPEHVCVYFNDITKSAGLKDRVEKAWLGDDYWWMHDPEHAPSKYEHDKEDKQTDDSKKLVNAVSTNSIPGFNRGDDVSVAPGAINHYSGDPIASHSYSVEGDQGKFAELYSSEASGDNDDPAYVLADKSDLHISSRQIRSSALKTLGSTFGKEDEDWMLFL